MRRIGFSLALFCVGLLILAPVTRAQSCHIEPTPAATLLLPYFEVDLNNFGGRTTLFSVNNASNQSVLAKVEVWSDLGVAVFGFMIYLKPYDVQSINLWDILANGALPQTGPGNFASCIGAMPPANLSPGYVFNYQRALTGQSVDLFGGACLGRNLHDNVARGYITVDAMSNCTTRFQGTPGVFLPGGNGDFTNQNVLWGDYFYSNGLLSQAEGHNLVSIVADSTNPATSTTGNYTFYGRFVNWTAVDNRVPLATNFGVRAWNYSPFSSDLVVWRDPKVNYSSPFTCGTYPSWYPLGQVRITAFDEDDHATTLTTNAFPAVAQRVQVGSSALPTPYGFGWLSLDLNYRVPAAGNVPPLDSLADQAWVTATMVNGSTLLGVDAMRLDSACHAKHSGL